MKIFDTNELRNIALVGHGASGKTTLSEAILYTTGITSRMGRVEDGNTKSDYIEDEIARQISISNSLLQTEWQNCKINIVDTPGYADFIGEVISGIIAIDTAVICVDAITGLEVGTETAWELCNSRNCIGGLTSKHFSMPSPTSPLCLGDLFARTSAQRVSLFP